MVVETVAGEEEVVAGVSVEVEGGMSCSLLVAACREAVYVRNMNCFPLDKYCAWTKFSASLVVSP